MAWIDNLLSIVVERGADEVRVAAGHEPLMFAGGAPRRLAIPKMSRQDIEDLLGGILSPDRKALVESGEKVEFLHNSTSHGKFRATITNENEVSVVFVKADRAAATPNVLSGRNTPEPAQLEPGERTREPHGTTAAGESRRENGAPLLFDQAARFGASDLHLSNGEVPLVRVDGTLRPVGTEKVTDVAAVLGLSPDERDTLAARGSLDFSARYTGAGSVRVHAYRAASGTSAAVRLLPDAAPLLSKLGMPIPLDDLAVLSHGLVLVTGPAGSGKSTTLAALAQEALRRRSIVLVTLEDPIELGLSPSDSSVLRRRQVGRDVPTFAAGLRDALREDPDVLVVGEMRDPETIALALTAAETGHLVLGSLHSRSAASAVQRIFDSYPPERQPYIRAQLAEALSAVVAQRLVARAGGPGRVPVLELLRVTTAVANTIREGRTASIPSLIQSGRREGMLSLERCLSDRVRAGELRLDDARSLASDAGSLTAYLND